MSQREKHMASTTESTHKKKLPGCLLRLVIKYRMQLKTIVLLILYGKSVNMEAYDSADG
jgi:hypothetical protein